jgi:hypothetical protein
LPKNCEVKKRRRPRMIPKLQRVQPPPGLGPFLLNQERTTIGRCWGRAADGPLLFQRPTNAAPARPRTGAFFWVELGQSGTPRDLNSNRAIVPVVCFGKIEQDDFSSIRHPALSFRLSMIFSENRSPLFRIML